MPRTIAAIGEGVFPYPSPRMGGKAGFINLGALIALAFRMAEESWNGEQKNIEDPEQG
jgi:hypothetical protein